MEYIIVYEYVDSGLKLRYILPIIFLILGVGLVYFNISLNGKQKTFRQIMIINIGFGFAIFGLISTIIIPIYIAKTN